MTQKYNHSFRQDLQGLRAVAISLVVLAHLNIPYLEGGFVGVDVFFVLSGYLITGILIREYNSTKTINFTRFYARRLKRLLPSLIFMIGVVLVVSIFILSPYEMISKSKSAIYASTWSSNFYFTFSKIGYFSELELKDIFLHTWSLSVEEQFYLIWPLFIFSSLVILSKKPKYNINNRLVIIFITTIFISFSISLYWSFEKPLWSFYLMPSRIWQFCLGGLILVLSKRKTKTYFSPASLQFFGLTLILFSGTLLDSQMTYPGWWALAPSIGTALVLLANHQSSKSLLTNSFLVWVGDRSYAWYLWHWPVIIFAESYGFGNYINESILLGALSLLIASLSYRYIEVPFWKGRLSKTRANKSIHVSVLSMLLIVAISITVSQHQENKMMANGSSETTIATTLPSIYSLGCDSWYSSPKLKPCTFNDNDFNKTVVLVGDSILAQWFVAIESIVSNTKWRLIVFTKSACPMIDEDFFYDRIGKTYDVCRVWRNNFIKELENLKPEMIILGNSSNYPFTDSQWHDGSQRVFSKLQTLTNEILIIPGTPALSYDGPSCLMRGINKDSTNHDSKVMNKCPAEKVSEHSKNITSLLTSASSIFKNTHIINLNDLVCPNDECRPVTHSGIPIFRDSQHLTNDIVMHLAPEIKNRINNTSVNHNFKTYN
jgi:peptidoglycan/LPS O-acetylase OafA/YrhL